MPELPEVETIVRGLRSLRGKTISHADVRLAKMAVAAPAVSFSTVRGERVRDVERRGKYAVLHLDSGRRLVTSLRMTGRLLVQRPRERSHPYTHVVLQFSDKTRLAFADARQFGRMRLVEADEEWDAHLGVEPLCRDFTRERFIGMLAGRKTRVKVFLLDQRHIAGIGNIHACEAQWRARGHHGEPANALTKPAVRRLLPVLGFSAEETERFIRECMGILKPAPGGVSAFDELFAERERERKREDLKYTLLEGLQGKKIEIPVAEIRK